MAKILNLILYNNSSEYNKMRDVLKNYLEKMGMEYYFYCYDNNVKADYEIKDRIIHIKGRESYLPGIYKKTVKAIEICLQFEFDYIVRTNISTVVDCENLRDYLNNTTVQYGGAQIFTLTWLDRSCGIYDHRYKGCQYVHGTGIIFSREMAKLIVANKNNLNYSVIDDVGIGLFYKSQNIPPQSLTNYTYLKNVRDITPKGLFYRNKRSSREDDVNAMTLIVDKLLNKTKEGKILSFSTSDINTDTNTDIDYAYYGSDTSYVNVIDIVRKRFISNKNDKNDKNDNKLIIPKDAKFNSVFGDPCVGVHKNLKLQINKNKFSISETRNQDVTIDLQ